MVLTLYVFLQLYWPADDSWYTGKVEGYNPETNEYTVVYDEDECVEYVDLSKEQVFRGVV